MQKKINKKILKKKQNIDSPKQQLTGTAHRKPLVGTY